MQLTSNSNASPIKFVGKYMLYHFIGSGSFADVYFARLPDNPQEFAVKQIPRQLISLSEDYFAALKYEVLHLKSIKHPNIVRFVETLVTKSNVYIVTEYCNGGNLLQHILRQGPSGLSEADALPIMRGIRDGFEELCRQGIIHNDFKLENVFLHNGVAKIGDFGVSASMHKEAGMLAGSRHIRAPELMFTDQFLLQKGKTDLWSIGCVFYYLLFGSHPVPLATERELFVALTGADFSVAFKKEVSAEMKDMIVRLLQRYPEKRICWVDFFAHPIFQAGQELQELQHLPGSKSTSKEIFLVDSDTEDSKGSKQDDRGARGKVVVCCQGDDDFVDIEVSDEALEP
jgi:serine/threonine protein kinase